MQLSTQPALFGHFRRLSAGAPVLMMRSYNTLPYFWGKHYGLVPKPTVGSIRISELILGLLRPIGGLKKTNFKRVLQVDVMIKRTPSYGWRQKPGRDDVSTRDSDKLQRNVVYKLPSYGSYGLQLNIGQDWWRVFW